MNIKNEIIYKLAALTDEKCDLTECRLMLLTSLGCITGTFIKEFHTDTIKIVDKTTNTCDIHKVIITATHQENNDADIYTNVLLLKDVTINNNIHVDSLIVFPDQVIAVTIYDK